jgi:hypothetical protein
VTTGPVRDFDLHPGEDDVRVFVCQPAGVLHLSNDVYASAERYGDVVLRTPSPTRCAIWISSTRRAATG